MAAAGFASRLRCQLAAGGQEPAHRPNYTTSMATRSMYAREARCPSWQARIGPARGWQAIRRSTSAREQEATLPGGSGNIDVLADGHASGGTLETRAGSGIAQSASQALATNGDAPQQALPWNEHGAHVIVSPVNSGPVSVQDSRPAATEGGQDDYLKGASSAGTIGSLPSDAVPEAVAESRRSSPGAGEDAAAGDADSASMSSMDKAKAKAKGGLGNRVLFGALLGVGGLAAVLIKQIFVAAAVFITFHLTQEFYSMVTSKGITRGMAPPSALVSNLTTVMCVSMVMFSTMYTGRSGIVLAVGAFALLIMNMVAAKRPTFSMLASTLFGVFYCGWLPSFWIKLRWLSTPAPDLPVIPALIGPFSSWTVGILSTFITILCVVAADVGAFFVGKNLGRTKLTDISPKKTVEGALGGLTASIGTALAMHKLTAWPPTPLAAATLGLLIFFSSLFGDLIESIIKRDAEMKDSGDMIPGHGGLLDRFDSYIFTGALVYCFNLYVLPSMI